MSEPLIGHSALPTATDELLGIMAERDQAVKKLERATSFVPEGYQTAKETLPEQVELMAEGLHAFQKASAGINAQLSMAVKEREEALDALKNLYEQGDIDHAEHVLRKHGRL